MGRNYYTCTYNLLILPEVGYKLREPCDVKSGQNRLRSIYSKVRKAVAYLGFLEGVTLGTRRVLKRPELTGEF